MLKLGHDSERLRIVIKAAEGFHALVERLLARMAEWRVTEIMHKRHRFGQIFIEPQCTGQSAGNLGNFYRVREARAIMIALMGDENLRLVLQAAKSGGMNDPVAVPLEWRAGRAFRLPHQTATAARRITGIGRAFAITKAYSFQRHCDASLTVI